MTNDRHECFYIDSQRYFARGCRYRFNMAGGRWKKKKKERADSWTIALDWDAQRNRAALPISPTRFFRQRRIRRLLILRVSIYRILFRTAGPFAQQDVALRAVLHPLLRKYQDIYRVKLKQSRFAKFAKTGVKITGLSNVINTFGDCHFCLEIADIVPLSSFHFVHLCVLNYFEAATSMVWKATRFSNWFFLLNRIFKDYT